MMDAIQKQETHQQTINQNFNVLRAEFLLFVAVAEYPSFKPSLAAPFAGAAKLTVRVTEG
jgi:hypothetical protein